MKSHETSYESQSRREISMSFPAGRFSPYFFLKRELAMKGSLPRLVSLKSSVGLNASNNLKTTRLFNNPNMDKESSSFANIEGAVES